MEQITHNDVQDFIKLLVTYGNLYYLDDDLVIHQELDGEKVTVLDEQKQKPLQILHTGMIKDENNFIFNPFKTIEGNNPGLNWFYTSRIMIASGMVKELILKLVELCASKDTKNYDILQLIDGVSELCDNDMLTEFKKITASDYLRIFYNRKVKTAEAQTAIFGDEIELQHKMRKKSWTVLRQLMRNLFKLGKDEYTLSNYKYRATILTIPEIDAKLHVLYMITELLYPWQDLIGQTFDLDGFKHHLENLETYARMCAWFTARTTNNQTVVTGSTPQNLPIRQDVGIPALPGTPAAASVAPVIPSIAVSTPTPAPVVNSGIPALQPTYPQVPVAPMGIMPATPVSTVAPVLSPVTPPFIPPANTVLPTAGAPITAMGQYIAPAYPPAVPTMSVPMQPVTAPPPVTAYPSTAAPSLRGYTPVMPVQSYGTPQVTLPSQYDAPQPPDMFKK